MRRILDRRLVAVGLLAIASAALLSAGLVTIFSTLADDHVDLPSRGSLEEILSDAREDGPEDTRGGAPVAAVDRDDPAPAGIPRTAVAADRDRTESAPTPTPSTTPAPTPSPTPAPTPTPSPTPSPPAPVAIAIPALKVQAPVVTLGLDAGGYPQVPDGPDVVAWYTFSAAPGRSSNAVFAGHVDWVDSFGEGMEGVFYRLHDLELDEVIRVTLEDGARLRYRVTGNVAVPYDDPDVLTVMDGTANDVITLITCGGTWQPDPDSRYRGNYSHRIIVRAERDVSGGPDGDG